MGNPADKSKTGGWFSAGLILVTELAERVCVIGISVNLVTYIVGDLHLSTSAAANIVTNFLGTLYLLALLGGFLADARLGRYLTVVIFAIVATIGVSLLTVATMLPSMRPPPCSGFRQNHQDCEEASTGQLVLLYVALYTTALGAGGIKANVSGFGTDQFDCDDPEEEKAMVFFSTDSISASAWAPFLRPQCWSHGSGGGVASGGDAAVPVQVTAGESARSVVEGILLCVEEEKAALSGRLPYPADAGELHEYHTSKVSNTQRYRCLDKAALVACTAPSGGTTASKGKPRASTENLCSVTEVEETKMVLKLIPIWSTCILFWTVYSQMTTFSVEQATYMDRHIGSFVFPAGSLSFFLFATILLFTSLNERLLGLTSLQRVGVGLVFSILAMAAAAVVERQRRESAIRRHHNISALWLVPQFFLVGAGEAFAYVGQLEFFIREAPERMKSMSTALFLATLSMGFFVSSLLVSLVGKATGERWIRNNLNMARLDYFYWMLAVLGVINIVIFLAFARRHQYKVQQPELSCDGERELKDCKRDAEGKMDIV
ncbi:unnamed protein product [Spirodela intermedia]|uniref:Uncharacterized protein n=1 Tax=Spirodela intermedia TaxID=51605 RepID=A0A7I8JIS5_SPIIN|nr:unnamed protein product [Spirodela intermedia]CAA6670010.1 unnamed protein product [Spirodela intermedia]